MTRGFRAALWFDAGVVLCDALIITGVYFFTTWITETIIRNDYFSNGAGVVFILFGLNYIFSRKRNDADPVLRSRNLKVFMNGFFINLLNPSVVLFWLGAMAITLSKFKYKSHQTFLYFLSALVTMAIMDIFKAYFAYKLSSLVHTRILRIIYISSGILMIGFGVYFIVRE